MTAQDTALSETAARAEIEMALCQLIDAQSRQRIVLAWSSGWILGDHAMELLTSLDLIESPEVADGE